MLPSCGETGRNVDTTATIAVSFITSAESDSTIRLLRRVDARVSDMRTPTFVPTSVLRMMPYRMLRVSRFLGYCQSDGSIALAQSWIPVPS